ncbi:MAG: hypothetical protein JW940_03730 [Polyangiaceae bacterium]|nr:hypothetical protein [Polyangiaceae bacterium]
MIPFEIHATFPAGTLLVGGYSAPPEGVDSRYACDIEGRPLIPATALRGALRESLEALLRGAGIVACQGGTGRSPGSPEPPTLCSLDDGSPCRACRLFGYQRSSIEPGERAFSSLVLGAATVAAPRCSWSERPGVSISRSRRSAEEDLLFERIVPDVQGLTLGAHGQVLDEASFRDLCAAARATTHIGSGRSRGYARVELKVLRREAAAPAEARRASGSAEPETHLETLWLRLETRAPAAIGGVAQASNHRECRPEIPGSMLRGAIGFALARALPDPDHDQAFQDLVAEAGAAFGFLYPTDQRGTQPATLAAPWPVTATACKARPSEHPVVDTLLDRIAAALAVTPDQARAVERLARKRECCPSCSEPLRAASGTRGSRKPVAPRLVTRVALDRATSSAADELLFSQELIEPGTAFEGPIRRIPPGTAHLLRGLAGRTVFVGRGTSAGQGESTVTLLAAPSMPGLVERGRSFAEALRTHLHGMGLPTDEVDRLVPITLLSPLLLSKHDGADGSETLLPRLGQNVGWLMKARRFGVEGTWDQRTGELFMTQAVAAGGVFVAKLPEPWKRRIEILGSLEAQGAGERTHQGFGHLVCFDPFIVERMASCQASTS